MLPRNRHVAESRWAGQTVGPRMRFLEYFVVVVGLLSAIVGLSGLTKMLSGKHRGCLARRGTE